MALLPHTRACTRTRQDDDEPEHDFTQATGAADAMIETVPPQLERDVANPHFGTYYTESTAPGEMVSPRPLFFLTLGKESRYAFGIASRRQDPAAVEQGAVWLQGSLQEIGIGAKTSAGYGYWIVDTDTTEPAPVEQDQASE